MLYWGVLLATFGAASERPKLLVAGKLIALAVLAVVTGHWMATGLDNLPALPEPPVVALFLVAACMAQLAVLFTLLVSAGPNKTFSGDTMARLLVVLPLGGPQRLLALLLPALILATLALLLVAESLIKLLLMFNMHPLLLPVAFIFGVISALGMVYGVPRLHIAVRLVAIGVVVWAEATQLWHMANSYILNVAQTDWRLWVVGAILAGSILLFLASFSSLINALATPPRLATVRTGFLPAWLWFPKKVLRSTFSVTNLGMNLVVSGALAWLMARSAEVGGGNQLESLSFIAAFIAAVTATDIRGLSRRVNPPEIVGLRGTAYFARHFYLWSGLLVFASVAPLMYPLLVTQAPPTDILFFALRTCLGISIGCFIGAMLTPNPRDITGQFLATLICIAALAGLPQVVPALQGTSTASMIGLVIASATAFIGGRIIEHKRNPFTWKDTHV